jgi:cellulose synthase operon protein C
MHHMFAAVPLLSMAPKLRLLSSILLLSVALLSGCSPKPAGDELAKAKAMVAQSDHRAAVVHLKGALQVDPSLAEARYLLGKSLLFLGDVPGARIELQRAKELGYSLDALLPSLGVTMIMMGDAARFITDADGVTLSSKESQAELLGVVGTAYGVRGKPQESQASAAEALRLDPRNATAMLVLARLKLDAGQVAEARTDLDALLQLHPHSVPALLLRAEVLSSQGAKIEDSIAAFEAVLKIEDRNIAALGAMTQLMFQNKEIPAAQRYLKRMMDAHPRHPLTQYHRALMALQAGALDDAAEQAQQLLKLVPEHAPALYLAGSIAFQRGAYLQAAAHLSKSAGKGAVGSPARQLLARTYLRLGDSGRALLVLRPLLEQRPVLAQTYGAAAEAYLMQGDTRQANEYFEKAVRLDPKDIQTQTVSAWSQLQTADAQAGLQSLQRIAANDSGVTADFAMVSVQVSQGQLDAALQTLDLIDRKQPGLPLVPTLRGRIEMQRGQIDKAREYFAAAQAIDSYFVPAVHSLATLDVLTGKRTEAEARYVKLLEAKRSSMEAEMALLGLKAESGAPLTDLEKLVDGIISRFPSDPQPRLALIRVRLDAGRGKEAIAAAQDGMAAFPQEVAFLDYLALAQLKAGEVSLALQTATKMAALQPGSPVPFLRMAEMTRAQQDLPATLAHLQRAISLRKDYLPAQSLLVGLLAGSKRVPEARSVVKTIQIQRPREPEGFMLEGDIEMLQANPGAAVNSYRKAIERGGSTQVAVKFYRALQASGAAEERKAFEERWLQARPRDTLFRMQLADEAMKSGDWARSEGLLAEVIRVEPKHALALNNLAWSQLELGKPEAKATIERAAALAQTTTPILDTYGRVLAKAGEIKKAIEVQRQALAAAPSLHVHRLHLAQYLAKAGQKEEALKEVKVLDALGPEFPEQAALKALKAQL